MKFIVKFEGKRGYAVSLDSRRLGLGFLDRVREELGVPHLPAEKVSDYLSGDMLNPIVEISESQARKSRLFGETSEVVVRVEHKTLNHFYNIGVEVKKDKETGEITAVRPVYELDETHLYEWWELVGFKTDFTKKEEQTADQEEQAALGC